MNLILIYMRIKEIFPFVLLVLFFACQERTEKKSITNDSTYVIPEMKVKPFEEGLALFTEPVFIKLKSNDIETDFSRVGKVKLVGDKLFLLDSRMKSLVVYQITGEAIGKVGKKGQGPNEYLDIADFDVDEQQTIYAIDGRQNKLFIYDSDFKFKSAEKLPFAADKIHLLENGMYMFALSSWNKGEGAGNRIAITDNKCNVVRTYLPYDEYIDENFWISDYQLTKTKDHILYNKTIDNNVYLFSLDGTLQKPITFDFGKENVPNEKKKDIEKYLKDFDSYSLLKDFTVIYSDIVLGTFWEHRKNKVFLLDTQKQILYKSKEWEGSYNSIYTGFCDSTLISIIAPDSYEASLDYKRLSSELLDHLDNGDFILALRTIK